MDGDAQRAREVKILADILALALDDQPGASASALEAIKQRARHDGVSGGALKDVFLRVRSDAPARHDDQGAVALARARARIEALQSQVAAVEQARGRDAGRLASLLRRARLSAWLGGALTGAGLAVLLRAALG